LKLFQKTRLLENLTFYISDFTTQMAKKLLLKE